MLLDAIFGRRTSQDTVLDDSVSEETLSKAIDFKIEQERTKQQYYRLENTNKFIDLLKLSGSLGLPLDQLLMLLGSYNTAGSSYSSTGTLSSSNSGNNHNNSVYYPDQTTQLSNSTQQQQTTYRFPPVNVSSNNSPDRSKKLNAVPSLGYVTPHYHRRVNSPARIGANAVASLSRNRSPAMIKEEEGPSQDMVSTPIATSTNPRGSLNVFSPLTGKNFNSFASPNLTTRAAPSTVSSTSPDTRSYYTSTATEYPPPHNGENAGEQRQSDTEFPCTTEVKGQNYPSELQSNCAPVSNTSTLLPSFSHLAATNTKHYGITKPFTPRGNHHRSRSLSSPSYYSFSSNPGTEMTQPHGSSTSVESTPVMGKSSSINVIDLDVIRRAQDSSHTPGRRSGLSKSTTLDNHSDNKKE